MVAGPAGGADADQGTTGDGTVAGMGLPRGIGRHDASRRRRGGLHQESLAVFPEKEPQAEGGAVLGYTGLRHARQLLVRLGLQVKSSGRAPVKLGRAQWRAKRAGMGMGLIRSGKSIIIY